MAFGPVDFQLRVVGGCTTLYLNMSFNRDFPQLNEGEGLLSSISGFDRRMKRPSFSICRNEVLFGNPPFSLLGMSFTCPLPQCEKNVVVNVSELTFGNTVSIVIAPTTKNWIKCTDDLDDRNCRDTPYFLVSMLMIGLPAAA